MTHVLTAKVGTNANLFPDILVLYAKSGDKIADVTYGKGVFWQQVDTSQYKCSFTDLTDGVDMRNLPYENRSINIVVIDPPYIYNPKRTVKQSISGCYGINETLKLETNTDVLNLYFSGLQEAHRVLMQGGYCIAKCQDVIQSNKQNWNHISIYEYAIGLGFRAEDLFILVQTSVPASRWKHQIHARKNHSYFWVFQKL